MKNTRLVGLVLLLAPALALGGELHGKASLGGLGLFYGGESSFRLTGRLELELAQLFGQAGSLKIDLQGRQASGGIAGQDFGIRELRFGLPLLAGKARLEAGRISLPELEGLQIDGATARVELGGSWSLQAAGGSGPAPEQPYGAPGSGRLGFGALLRKEGAKAGGYLGISERRRSGGMERRAISGSVYARPLRSISTTGFWTLDLGQPGSSSHLTNLSMYGSFRPGRAFDVSVGYSSTAYFRIQPDSLDDRFSQIPIEFRPELPPLTERFGPRQQSASLRAQVSPLHGLSVFGEWRPDLSARELDLSSRWRGGLRAQLGKGQSTELLADYQRVFRDSGRNTSRVRAGGRRQFSDKLELEAYGTLARSTATTGTTSDPGFEVQASYRLSRTLLWFQSYAYDRSGGAGTHVAFGQLAFRF